MVKVNLNRDSLANTYLIKILS